MHTIERQAITRYEWCHNQSSSMCYITSNEAFWYGQSIIYYYLCIAFQGKNRQTYTSIPTIEYGVLI